MSDQYKASQTWLFVVHYISRAVIVNLNINYFLNKFYSLAEQITRNVDILMIPDANIDARLILFDDDSEQFRVDPDNQGEGDVSQTIEYWISPIESLADWNKFFLWKKTYLLFLW